MKQLLFRLLGSRKAKPVYRMAEYCSKQMSKTLNLREETNIVKIDLYYEH